MGRITILDPQSRDYILSLPGDQMREFARRLNDRQLAAFADYERNLEPIAAKRLPRAVADDPSVMQELTTEGLREAILKSRDQLAALNMIIHDDAKLDQPVRLHADFQGRGACPEGRRELQGVLGTLLGSGLARSVPASRDIVMA